MALARATRGQLAQARRQAAAAAAAAAGTATAAQASAATIEPPQTLPLAPSASSSSSSSSSSAAGAAGAAPALPPVPTPAPAPVPAPAASATLELHNVFLAQELEGLGGEERAEAVADISADVRDECAKYGVVLRVDVDAGAATGGAAAAVHAGSVPLRVAFASVADAARSVAGLRGRKFDGRVIEVSYV